MEKKLNGFNNGRDTTQGIGGSNYHVFQGEPKDYSKDIIKIDINVLPEKDREYEELKKGNEKLQSQIDELVECLKDNTKCLEILKDDVIDNENIQELLANGIENNQQLLQKHKSHGK